MARTTVTFFHSDTADSAAYLLIDLQVSARQATHCQQPGLQPFSQGCSMRMLFEVMHPWLLPAWHLMLLPCACLLMHAGFVEVLARVVHMPGAWLCRLALRVLLSTLAVTAASEISTGIKSEVSESGAAPI